MSVKKMKPYKCDGCQKNIEVPNDYKAKFCCDGRECGCYGSPINPMLCDECEEKAFGKRVDD